MLKTARQAAVALKGGAGGASAAAATMRQRSALLNANWGGGAIHGHY
jgi:hypothetical protein